MPSKDKEYAPGLPEKGKITPLPEIKKPEFWEFSAHPHEAERAGRHIDIRFGNPKSGIAHSFVLPKAELPSPGAMLQVIPTSDHSLGYMDFSGEITKGYGKGKVIPGRRTVAEVYHAESSDKPGTKLRFNLYEGDAPQEYSIRKDKEDRWFIHNKTQTRLRREDLPSFKPSYKEQDISLLDLKDSKALMPKLDGAHTLIDLQAGRSPRAFSYRIAKKTGTGLIEHTHKIPQLLEVKVPKEFDKTILRAETVGIKDGKPIPAEQTGGFLNAKVLESRKKQEQDNVRLKVFPFSVERFKGKDVSGLSFEEKQKLLDRIVKAIPDLGRIPVAVQMQDKIRLLNEVKSGTHPLTTEGVVSVEPNKLPEQFIKSKITPDFDVYVQAVHPAISGTTGKTHERAGAISYSWAPDGPVVGTLGGFKHDEAKDMLSNPDKYIGRVAKVKALKVFKDGDSLGALFQPRFIGWHLDKGEIEKLGSISRGNNMPFKSEAQRRYMHAKHPTIAKRWEKHTPKGEKLPEKIAEALQNGFLDELIKISSAATSTENPSFLSKAKNWVSAHPGTTAIIGGGLVGGGIVGAKMVPGKLSTIPTISNIQRAARKGGIGFTVTTSAKNVKDKVPMLERIKARLTTGGHTPIYLTEAGDVMDISKPVASKRVTVGVTDSGLNTKGELHLGGVSPGSEKAKSITKVIDELESGGKPRELEKSVGLSQYFGKGMDISAVMKKYNIAAPGQSLNEQAAFLRKLQGAMKAEFGEKGFVMKPSGMAASGGAFPSQEGDWASLWKDYIRRLKPKMDKDLADMTINPQDYDKYIAPDLMLALMHRNDPAYVGTALESALRDPIKTLGQEKLDLVRHGPGTSKKIKSWINTIKGRPIHDVKGDPAEYRVHVIGGEVPHSLAYERYAFGREGIRRIPLLKNLRRKKFGTPEDAAKWVRENVVPSLQKELKEGTLGLDVARVKNIDGSYGYKIIELNPSHPVRGGSGFLDAELNPAATQDVSRFLLGRSDPLTSVAHVGIGGAPAALGSYAGASALNSKK